MEATVKAVNDQMEDIIGGYIECAIWAAGSPFADDDPRAGDELDQHYSADDLADEAQAQMAEDVVTFARDNAADVVAAADQLEYGYPAIGHDLWLTRNGHGAGFWDRGLGELGDRLSDAAQAAGERYLYPGDDDQVYYS